MSRKGGVTQWKQYCLNHTHVALNPNSDTNCTIVGKLSRVLEQTVSRDHFALTITQATDEKGLKQATVVGDGRETFTLQNYESVC